MLVIPPDLLIASVEQTVLDNTVRKIISTTRPRTSGRPSKIQKVIPDNRPLCDVPNDWQKCNEWGIKMWTATVDFTRAFDSITHISIWKLIKSCGIKHDYISFLKKIYRDQKASVQTDVESNMFETKKGTKHGDPLSSLLFNTVLQYSLKDDIQAMAKETRNGNLSERPRPRLPHESEVCRRRAAVRNL